MDIVKMMADLAESGRQQRLIEAERPSAEVIGEALGAFVAVTRRVLDRSREVALLRQGVNPDEEYGLRCGSGALGVEDTAWLVENLSFDVPPDESGDPIHYLAHPLVDPAQCILDFVQRFVRAAMDYLEGLAHLVKDDVSFRATAVLSRAALEACAAASYVIDPEVSSAERFRRLWNMQCEQLTDDALRDPEDAGDARSHRDQILVAAESVGFGVRRVKPSERYRAPCVLAEDGKPRSSTQEMIEAVLTSDLGRSMWQGLSDVAHSRSSGLMFLDEVSPREKQIRAMRTESIAFHAMPALLAFSSLGDQLERYLGWKDLSWTESMVAVLHLWNASSGAVDHLIRANLGLPAL